MEFVDRLLTCADCGGEFIFTAGEQLFFLDKQFKNDPKRCKPCKSRRSAQQQARLRAGGPAAAGISRTETRTECSECGIVDHRSLQADPGPPGAVPAVLQEQARAGTAAERLPRRAQCGPATNCGDCSRRRAVAGWRSIAAAGTCATAQPGRPRRCRRPARAGCPARAAIARPWVQRTRSLRAHAPSAPQTRRGFCPLTEPRMADPHARSTHSTTTRTGPRARRRRRLRADHLHRRHLPAGRRRHVRRGAEDAVAEAHRGRRGEPDPAGAELRGGAHRQAYGGDRDRHRQQTDAEDARDLQNQELLPSRYAAAGVDPAEGGHRHQHASALRPLRLEHDAASGRQR